MNIRIFIRSFLVASLFAIATFPVTGIAATSEAGYDNYLLFTQELGKTIAGGITEGVEKTSLLYKSAWSELASFSGFSVKFPTVTIPSLRGGALSSYTQFSQNLGEAYADNFINYVSGTEMIGDAIAGGIKDGFTNSANLYMQSLTKSKSLVTNTTTDTTQSLASIGSTLDSISTSISTFWKNLFPSPLPAPTQPTTPINVVTPKVVTPTIVPQPKPAVTITPTPTPKTATVIPATSITGIEIPPPSAPIVQNIILPTSSSSELNTKIEQLRNELLAKIGSLSARDDAHYQGNFQAIALTNKIDQLTNTVITNPTITGASITGGSISGATISGSLSVSSGTFSGNLTVSGTGTSTFAGDSAFDTDTFYVDSLNNRVGIATSSPSDTLALNGAAYFAQISAPGVTTNRLYNTGGLLYFNGTQLGAGGSGSSTFSTTTSQVSGQLINYPTNATDIVTIGSSSTTTAPFFFDPNSTTAYISGKLGIGTTSPYAKLSVVGETVSSYFTATSTTATSTFANYINVGNTKGYQIGGITVLQYDADYDNIQIGQLNDTASGGTAVAIGSTNTVSTIAVGIAIGYNNTAGGTTLNTAIGISNTASGPTLANAIGYNNQATSSSSTAIGLSNNAGSLSSIAIGKGNNAWATGAIAIGSNITNTTSVSLMIGPSDAAKATILSSGNFGIGTTSPYAKLSVVGETVSSYFTATSTTATSTFGGAIGIGTTSPQAKLHVSTGWSGTLPNTNVDDFVVESSGNAGMSFLSPYASISSLAFGNPNAIRASGISRPASTDALAILTGTFTETARFTSTGFGIGTTSPYAKLSVVGEVVASNFTATSTSATSTFLGPMNFGTTTAGGRYNFTGDGTGSYVGGFGAVMTLVNNSGADWNLVYGNNSTVQSNWIANWMDNSGNLWFSTASNAGVLGIKTGTGAVAINSTANTAPKADLDIFSASGSSGNPKLYLSREGALSAGMVLGEINFYGSLLSSNAARIVATNNASVTQDGSFDFYVGTNAGTRALTIANTGNVGLGTTSPYAKLAVAGQVVADYFTATSTTASSTFSGDVVMGTGGTGFNFIRNGQDVGIGISTPSARLHVLAGSGDVPLIVQPGDAGSNIQRWVNYSGTTASYVDSLGSLFIDTAGVGYSLFGPAPTDLSITTTIDRLVAVKKNNSTSAGRALTGVVEFIYTDGLSSSLNIGLNGFAYYQSNQNLTIASNSGGLSGGRYAVRIGSGASGSPTISLATGVSSGFSDTLGSGATPTITEFTNFQAESISSTYTTFGTTTGFWMRNPTTSGGSVASAVGLRVDGLTAATNNWAIYTDGTTKSYFGGNIGIGTTTPFSPLSVATGNMSAFNGAICADNGGVVKCYGSLTAGTVYGDASTFASSDLAENYPIADESLEAGDIVMVADELSQSELSKRENDRNKLNRQYKDETPSSVTEALASSVVKADQTNTANIIGVVSTKPGVLLGDITGLGLETDFRPIALAGRVPVKVTGEGGDIKKGDRITISKTFPGVGTKASTSGYTIGIALEPHTFSSSSEIASILLFLNLSWSKLDPAVADGTILDGNGESSFWSVEEGSGRIKFISAGIDLNDQDIVSVRAITGSAGKWSIDGNGKLSVEDLEVRGNVKVGSSDKRTGVTLYDEETGAPYCLTISGGTTKTTSGECGQSALEPTSPPVEPEPEPQVEESLPPVAEEEIESVQEGGDTQEEVPPSEPAEQVVPEDIQSEPLVDIPADIPEEEPVTATSTEASL